MTLSSCESTDLCIYKHISNRNCSYDLCIITIYSWSQSSQPNKLPVLSYLSDMWFSELTFSLYCHMQGLGWSRDEIFVYTATLLTLSCRCKSHAMCCSSGLLHRLPAVQWFVAAWIFHSASWFHRPVNERWKLTSLVSLVIGSVWSSFSSWDVQCWFAQSRYTQNPPTQQLQKRKKNIYIQLHAKRKDTERGLDWTCKQP